jgi:biotin operon repressor
VDAISIQLFARFDKPAYFVSDHGQLAIESPEKGFLKLPITLVAGIPTTTFPGIGPELLTLAAICNLPEVRSPKNPQLQGQTYRRVKPNPEKPGNSIAEKCGLPERTVKRHLQTLEKWGFIIKLKRTNGRRSPTLVVDPDTLYLFLNSSKELNFYPLLDRVRALGLTWSESLLLSYLTYRSHTMGGVPTAVNESQQRIAAKLGLDREIVGKAMQRIQLL